MIIEEFERQLKLNYSSQKTVESYIKQVRPFLKFCDNNITQENLDDYLLQRREKVSPTSYNLFLNAFIKYCEFANIIFTLPKQQNVKAKVKPYWSLEELENEIISNSTLMFSDYEEVDMVLYFMFFTGLRPEKLREFEIKDIDFNKCLFRVQKAKGGKDRIIPFLNNKLTNKLKTYIANLNRKTLFDYTANQLAYIFTKIKMELSLDYQVSPYIMRRSFAKHCITLGIDISLIQIMMGHEDIKTTLRYAKPDDKILMDICEKVRLMK